MSNYPSGNAGSSIPRLYAAASLKRMPAKLRPCELAGIPRLYAAASLKPYAWGERDCGSLSIPRLYAAASLKRLVSVPVRYELREYSAALCRGLIEAWLVNGAAGAGTSGIPRLYAAASLKPTLPWVGEAAGICIPRLYAAASLKPGPP